MSQFRGKPSSGNPTSGLLKVLMTSGHQMLLTTRGIHHQEESSALSWTSQHSSLSSTTQQLPLTGSLSQVIATSPSPAIPMDSPQGTSTPTTTAASTGLLATVGTRNGTNPHHTNSFRLYFFFLYI
uniref:Unkown protein n=1 Tax=Riptortus pedestris TaxID=329032 RepID=R4WCW9_RIPPE|nr:unkown protein [Riptortus pedestris]